MGESPSSPGDGLEDALRRALSDAVGRIEPGTDGLDSIRARIGRRPPRPWLFAVLSGAAERARSWTWRGHWAWPGWPLARTHLTRRGRRPRHRKGTPAGKPSRRGGSLPLLGALGALGGWRAGWLTLAAGFAGIALIASVSFGVQPVRQTIIQAGTTVLHGDGAYPPPPPWGGGGTDGAGTQTTAGPGPVADGGPTAGAQPSPTGASSPGGGPGGAAPGPGSSAACQPPTAGATGKPTPAAAGPGTTSSTWPAGVAASPGTTRSTYPVAPGVTGSPDQPTATPDSPATSASTCAVTPGPATTTPATTTPATTTPSAGHADADDAGYAGHATGSHRRALDTERRHTGQYAHVNPGRHAHVHGDRRACQQSRGPGHRHGIGAGYRRPHPRLAGSGSWRWYARLRFLPDERHRAQR